MINLNRTVFEILFQWSGRSPFFDAVIVFFARFLPYLIVLGFLIWAFSRENWKFRWFVFAEGAMAIILSRGIIIETIRFFYHSPRPFEALSLSTLLSESSSSYPSCHAAVFFAMAMTVFYYSRRLGWWFFAFAFLNGLARVVAGVHWPFDILGGAGAGILSAALVYQIIRPQLKQIEEKTSVR
jgi:undecaprenyl-diphosphatase